MLKASANGWLSVIEGFFEGSTPEEAVDQAKKAIDEKERIEKNE